jgi:hypothetical protein
MTAYELTEQDLAELRRIHQATKSLVKPADVEDLLRDRLDRDKLDQLISLRMVLRLWAGDNWAKYGAAVRKLELD